MATKTRKARSDADVKLLEKPVADLTPAERRRHQAMCRATVAELTAAKEERERLRSVAAHWHARVQGIVESLYDSVHNISRNLGSDAGSPLHEYLDKESVLRVLCCLDQCGTALMTMTPRERLDLPRPLALLTGGGA
jgi:hypothetical protein